MVEQMHLGADRGGNEIASDGELMLMDDEEEYKEPLDHRHDGQGVSGRLRAPEVLVDSDGGGAF